jgi:hypothetical protein
MLTRGEGDKSTWDAFIWNECLCSSQANYGVKRDANYFPVGPRYHFEIYCFFKSFFGYSQPLSGLVTGSLPIPGYEGYDCSRRSCPKGHDTRFSESLASLEIQRVVCSADSENTSFSFRLSLYGENSPPVYSYYGSLQIKSAIESMSSVGNISVWFPNEGLDSISTACSLTMNLTHGGFLIQFETEFGNLPLLDANVPLVTITELQEGTNVSFLNLFHLYLTGCCSPYLSVAEVRKVSAMDPQVSRL